MEIQPIQKSKLVEIYLKRRINGSKLKMKFYLFKVVFTKRDGKYVFEVVRFIDTPMRRVYHMKTYSVYRERELVEKLVKIIEKEKKFINNLSKIHRRKKPLNEIIEKLDQASAKAVEKLKNIVHFETN